MGNARWSHSDWIHHARATSHQSRDQIFAQHDIHAELDPAKIKLRESVDSPANPQSTPIIIAADETGSMGVLAETIIKRGLGVIMEAIYDRQPVPDPHICCMGLGDAYCDWAPLQVTQFEASVAPLVDQVKKIYIEGGGGGNGGESYPLAWWFACYKTKCDAIAKRKRKGYLFTIGDECPHDLLTREQVRRFCGVGCERNVPAADLLELAQRFWHVFHLIVKPVGDQPVLSKWRELLAERAIVVDDHERLAEGIVSTIQIVEGHDADSVAGSWDRHTSGVIRNMARQLLGV